MLRIAVAPGGEQMRQGSNYRVSEVQIPDEFEVLELDDRLDMAIDPLSVMADTCCATADNCRCCP